MWWVVQGLVTLVATSCCHFARPPLTTYVNILFTYAPLSVAYGSSNSIPENSNHIFPRKIPKGLLRGKVVGCAGIEPATR